MKITEMNNCIEKMREIYKFDDENTEIILIPGVCRCRESMIVELRTKDENGTEITMTREADSVIDFASI